MEGEPASHASASILPGKGMGAVKMRIQLEPSNASPYHK